MKFTDSEQAEKELDKILFRLFFYGVLGLSTIMILSLIIFILWSGCA